VRRVRILGEAAEEAIATAAWYEREPAGLGVDFSQAVDAATNLLEEEIVPPHKHARWGGFAWR
jgi:hypothetical protein